MKNHGKFLLLVIQTISVTLTLTLDNKALAQQTHPVTILRAKRQNSQKQVEFIVGQTVSYKPITSKTFEIATITGITDSTISFENKKTGNVTILHKNLEVLKVRGSRDRRAVGTTLLVLGAAGVLVGIFAEGISESSIGSGEGDPGAIALIVGGGAAMIGGIVLKRVKTIDLTKSWKLTAGKRSEDIAVSDKREYKGFKVGLGLGSGSTLSGSGAWLISAEPAYRVRPNLVFGLKIEGIVAAGEGSILHGGSFTLNGQYYLSSNKFRPFVGCGLGLYAFGDPEFGFYPRVGFDIGQFSLTLDYNIISATASGPTYVGPTSSQINGQPVVYYAPVSYPVTEQVTKYLGVRIGYSLGGTRK